jgi:hypothetical protein
MVNKNLIATVNSMASLRKMRNLMAKENLIVIIVVSPSIMDPRHWICLLLPIIVLLMVTTDTILLLELVSCLMKVIYRK